jgi:excisionase family DNA binding protein
MFQPPSSYYSINEIAQYLGVSAKTVYRALWSGRMAGRRFGRTWRVRTEWADAFLMDEHTPPSCAVAQ